MLDISKMCIMASKFIILHFKDTIMFTQFSDESFPHITYFFHLQMCCVQFD